MIKRTSIAAVIAACLFASCHKEMPVSYDNSFDPGGSAYVPTRPDSIFFAAQCDTGIDLRWIDRSLNEDGFYIERKDDKTNQYSQVAALPKDSTHYFDAFVLQSGTVYTYRIASFCGDRRSLYSSETGKAVTLFHILYMDASVEYGKQILVRWNYYGTQPLSFVIERAVENGPFTVIAIIKNPEVYYHDQDTHAGVSYRYRMKAAGKYTESPYSPVVPVYFPSGN